MREKELKRRNCTFNIVQILLSLVTKLLSNRDMAEIKPPFSDTIFDIVRSLRHLFSPYLANSHSCPRAARVIGKYGA